MQSPFRSLGVGAALAFLLSSLAGGQDRGQSAPRPVDASALEKRIAELEGRLSAVGKEVEELRQEVRAQSSVVVVPLHDVDAKEIVKVIRTIYRGHPGVEIGALVKTRAVIVRADEKTKADILELIGSLEVLSQAKKGAEQRVWKLEKAANGRTTANRLIFPEAVERAMLMDACTPGEQFYPMEQKRSFELNGPMKLEDRVLPDHLDARSFELNGPMKLEDGVLPDHLDAPPPRTGR
jgi:hypothetical protein